MEIDIVALRNDLINYLGTAKEYNPTAVMDLIEVEHCGPDRLLAIAVGYGFDLNEYDVNKGRRF